jgi:hypothetical protein
MLNSMLYIYSNAMKKPKCLRELFLIIFLFSRIFQRLFFVIGKNFLKGFQIYNNFEELTWLEDFIKFNTKQTCSPCTSQPGSPALLKTKQDRKCW